MGDGHEHGHHHHHDGREHGHGRVLTIRAHSGLSGDMFLAGLMCVAGIGAGETDALLTAVMPELAGSVRLIRKEVRQVGGMHAEVSLPHQHEHRSLADILGVIAAGGMDDAAKELASDAFSRLARAEAAVHGTAPEAVRFHEVGALDSVLDICVSCALFVRLAPDRLVVSPLPLADGCVDCAHGILPAPAPAVLEMLEGVPVRPFAGTGETVTPTALALLLAMKAEFGPWPAMRVERRALVYGTREFENAPNGAVFALGVED